MHIAICDDDIKFTEELKFQAEKGFAALGLSPEFSVFSDSAEFISSFPECDAVFLDIDMPQVNGFEIAEAMNRAGDSLIVFVTSYDELVYSSIKFRPFRFVRKSRLETELPEVLEALSKAILKRISGKRFRLRTNTKDVLLRVDEIKYIESFGHWLNIYTNDKNKIEYYGSLSEMEKQLAELDFVRVHKSYLVNLKYVYSIERMRIILTDKTEIPLSRYKAETVKNRVKNYILNEL